MTTTRHTPHNLILSESSDAVDELEEFESATQPPTQVRRLERDERGRIVSAQPLSIVNFFYFSIYYYY